MQNHIELTRNILNTRGYIRIPSNGISMAPMIRTGDICQFEPVRSFRDLKKGDILLYESLQGDMIGHRYIGTISRQGETLIICKGDYNRNPDEPISIRQVIGKMRSRNLGMKLWGKIIVHFPFVSLWVQKLYKRGRNKWLFLFLIG